MTATAKIQAEFYPEPGKTFIPYQTFGRNYINVIYNIMDGTLNSNEKDVLIAMNCFSFKDGLTYPKQETLAEKAGMRLKALQRTLNSLEEKGFILRLIPDLRERWRGERTYYYFLYHEIYNRAANGRVLPKPVLILLNQAKENSHPVPVRTAPEPVPDTPPETAPEQESVTVPEVCPESAPETAPEQYNKTENLQLIKTPTDESGPKPKLKPKLKPKPSQKPPVIVLSNECPDQYLDEALKMIPKDVIADSELKQIIARAIGLCGKVPVIRLILYVTLKEPKNFCGYLRNALTALTEEGKNWAEDWKTPEESEAGRIARIQAQAAKKAAQEAQRLADEAAYQRKIDAEAEAVKDAVSRFSALDAGEQQALKDRFFSFLKDEKQLMFRLLNQKPDEELLEHPTFRGYLADHLRSGHE